MRTKRPERRGRENRQLISWSTITVFVEDETCNCQRNQTLRFPFGERGCHQKVWTEWGIDPLAANCTSIILDQAWKFK